MTWKPELCLSNTLCLVFCLGCSLFPSFFQSKTLVFHFCWSCIVWVTRSSPTSSLWDDVITAVHRARNKKSFPHKIRGTEKKHWWFMLAEILTQKLWTCSSCYLLYVTINPRQERLLRALSLQGSHSFTQFLSWLPALAALNKNALLCWNGCPV